MILSAFALAVLCACTPSPQPLQGDALIARGAYLVNGLGGCNDCHTPMTPTGPDMTQALRGAELIFAPKVEMPWASYAPPLAGGPAGYTEEQFVALLQTGLRPDGTMPAPPMPQFRMNEEDARAVVAYINAQAPAPSE
jgi:mono/diheme cytochrome c family protein